MWRLVLVCLVALVLGCGDDYDGQKILPVGEWAMEFKIQKGSCFKPKHWGKVDEIMCAFSYDEERLRMWCDDNKYKVMALEESTYEDGYFSTPYGAPQTLVLTFTSYGQVTGLYLDEGNFSEDGCFWAYDISGYGDLR